MKLKLGCTVWFLEGDEIIKGMFHDEHYHGGPILVDVLAKRQNAAGQVVTSMYLCDPRLLFESREALCEHYRKIFDNKIDLPRKARVINEERLLYGEVVNIFKSRLMFLDEDNESYEKEELRFL